MLEFQRKRNKRKILYSKLSVLVLCIFSIMLLKGAIGLYSKAQASSEARQISENELKELTKRKAFVESEISRLRTSEGIEKEIREKFSVAKPDEELVVMIASAVEPVPMIKQSLFNKIWQKTKGLFGNSEVKVYKSR